MLRFLSHRFLSHRRSWRRSNRQGSATFSPAAALGWIVPVGVALLIAFGIGTASARAVLGAAGEGRFGRVGAWSLEPTDGGSAVDPYSRARLARTGTVPMGGAEGLILFAARDGRGRPLDARCRYRVVGPMPLARRWSLWVEPETGDPARPAALHSRAILRDRQGRFTVEVAPSVAPGNWLAAPREGPFTLHLALYDTPVARTGRASALTPPALRRLACDGPVGTVGGTVGEPAGSAS